MMGLGINIVGSERYLASRLEAVGTRIPESERGMRPSGA